MGPSALLRRRWAVLHRDGSPPPQRIGSRNAPHLTRGAAQAAAIPPGSPRAGCAPAVQRDLDPPDRGVRRPPRPARLKERTGQCSDASPPHFARSCPIPQRPTCTSTPGPSVAQSSATTRAARRRVCTSTTPEIRSRAPSCSLERAGARPLGSILPSASRRDHCDATLRTTPKRKETAMLSVAFAIAVSALLIGALAARR